MCFSLALRLKMRVQEVEHWPLQEIRDWAAFLEILERRKES